MLQYNDEHVQIDSNLPAGVLVCVPIRSLDVYNLKDDAAIFAGKRGLISFLSWLDYCDQLIKEAQKVCANTADAIYPSFLSSLPLSSHLSLSLCVCPDASLCVAHGNRVIFTTPGTSEG